jgi:hypothetical protein
MITCSHDWMRWTKSDNTSAAHERAPMGPIAPQCQSELDDNRVTVFRQDAPEQRRDQDGGDKSERQGKGDRPDCWRHSVLREKL